MAVPARPRIQLVAPRRRLPPLAGAGSTASGSMSGEPLGRLRRTGGGTEPGPRTIAGRGDRPGSRHHVPPIRPVVLSIHVVAALEPIPDRFGAEPVGPQNHALVEIVHRTEPPHSGKRVPELRPGAGAADPIRHLSGARWSSRRDCWYASDPRGRGGGCASSPGPEPVPSPRRGGSLASRPERPARHGRAGLSGRKTLSGQRMNGKAGAHRRRAKVRIGPPCRLRARVRLQSRSADLPGLEGAESLASPAVDTEPSL